MLRAFSAQHTDPRRVLILVPNRWRDLEGHALVAYHLKNAYGHEVELCNEGDAQRKLMKLGPDGLVIDHLGIIERVELAMLAKRLGTKVFLLPTAGFFQDMEREARRAGKLFGASQLVDAYFAWGCSGRDYLQREKLLSERQLHTIGCVRFDLYSEPYTSLVRPKDVVLSSLGIKRNQSPLIVWTTNTYFANLGDPEQVVRAQALHAKRPIAELRAEIEDCITQFREHTKTVATLARRHPDWNFLIKIHPTEARQPYESLKKQAKNIYLVNRLSAREVLFHCDVLIQRGCTTATEAWMLGKPVIELSIGHYNDAIGPEYLAGNSVAHTLEDVENAIEGYVKGVVVPEKQRLAREAFIRDVYYKIDGKASARAAELIAHHLSPAYYSDLDQAHTRKAAREAFSCWLRNEDRRFGNLLKDLLGINREISIRVWKNWRRKKSDLNHFGLFAEDNNLTPELVQTLLLQYHKVLAAPVPSQTRSDPATV